MKIEKLLSVLLFPFALIGLLQTFVLFYQIWFVWGPWPPRFVGIIYCLRVIYGVFGLSYVAATIEMWGNEKDWVEN